MLLAADLAEVSEASLRRFIDQRVPEDHDLDFKQAFHEQGPKGAYELAKDMAAFANHIGGLLVIGIREVGGVACELTPIDLSGGHENRLRQTLAARVNPLVQSVEVREVASSVGPDRGYLLVYTPRSSDAPHGVIFEPKDDRRPLVWPVRNGTSTRYLHQDELARRYRDRFSAQQVQAQQLSNLFALGNQQPEVGSVASLLLDMAILPTMKGDRPLTGDTTRIDDFLDAQHSVFGDLHGPSLRSSAQRVTLRRDRLRCELNEHRFEFHRDGSAWGRTFIGTPSPISNVPMDISLRQLESQIVYVLSTLSQYAIWAGASGDCLLSARLHGRIGDRLRILGSDSSPLSETVGAVVPPSEITIALEECREKNAILRASYEIAKDLEQDLGIREPASLGTWA